jgi:hypothetical protein
MKKTLFFLAIASVLLFACNPLKPTSSAEPSYFNKADSIPESTASLMITHYLDAAVDKSIPSLTRSIVLYNSDLFKIFKINNTTRIKLYVAAYLSTDTLGGHQDKPTVLLQVKKGYHSNYYYYDVQRSGSGRLCPPPPGCIPTIP